MSCKIFILLLLMAVMVVTVTAAFDLTLSDIAAGKKFAEKAEQKRKLAETNNKLSAKIDDTDVTSILAPALEKATLNNNANLRTLNEDVSADFILNFMKAVCKIKSCTKEDKREFSKLSIPEGLEHLCNYSDTSCSSKSLKYRTIDGTCNNLKYPRAGSAYTPQLRFVESAYEDFFQEPRSKSVTGEPLSSPRHISDIVLTDIKRESKQMTTLSTYFGQFLSHDISLTPVIVTPDKRTIQCCNNTTVKHPACFEIPISENDATYSKFGIDCMNFVRSAATLAPDCRFGVRAQENEITSYVDASFVYGSEEGLAEKLREKTKGLLKTVKNNVLPPNTKPQPNSEPCVDEQDQCPFLAGDKRVNENPALTICHLLFLREHNRIAKELRYLHPRWEDERLYQEARKIVIGFLQNIVYSEYLPTVVGPDFMKIYDLDLPYKPDRHVYDYRVAAGAKNEFSTAAFRFGHATVPNLLQVNFLNDLMFNIDLDVLFFNTTSLYQNEYVNGITAGMTDQGMRKYTEHMASSVTKKLFRDVTKEVGLDLASINIQRGRDHGIPGFNRFREYIGMKPYKSFNDIPVSQNTRSGLANVYKHVDDIDLFVGGLTEKPVRGGIVGPVFATLISEQFLALKRGDRYFFTNGRKPHKKSILGGHGYNKEQIIEFRLANLARIICDNTRITHIQIRPMEKAHYLTRNNFNLPFLMAYLAVIAAAFDLTPGDIAAGKEFAEKAEQKRKMVEKTEKLSAKIDDNDESSILAPALEKATVNNIANLRTLSEDLAADFILNFMKAVCEIKSCTESDKREFSKLRIPEELKHLCTGSELTCSSKSLEYRTIDGTCNNLKHPREGSSYSAQSRFVESAYEDFFQEPRSTSVTGEPLPSPRHVSDVVLTDIKRESNSITTLFTYFGQFLTHEITLTPVIVTPEKRRIRCCGDEPEKHPACFEIPVSANDSTYSKFGIDCLNFVRSTACLHSDCRFGVRSQENEITSYLDASFVYGSEEEVAEKLRENKNGLLKSVKNNVLPPNTTPRPGRTPCDDEKDECPFLAGDKRANENAALAIFHILFLREHNRISNELRYLYPSWEDEKLFQETRKIVIGFLQNIVYSEYLPVVIGPDFMKIYDLHLPYKPDKHVYDYKVSASTRTEFSTAAFRFGHAMVPNLVQINFANEMIHNVDLDELFNNVTTLHRNEFVNGIAEGMTQQGTRMFDEHMASSVTKNLFRSGRAIGLDLASFNIQRGRDHGIPGYNKLREWIGLKSYKSFEKLPVSGKTRMGLAKVYKHVDDIDLFVGGLLENPVKGGVVGPVFATLIAEQFLALAKGDRYFFTNGRKPHKNSYRGGHGYNKAQIIEFRLASLARIICDNTRITHIQIRPMEKANYHTNPIVKCEFLPRPDIPTLMRYYRHHNY